MGYSVNTNPTGTVTVTVTDQWTLNPTTLRQVLAQAGVPAVINVGSFCSTPTQPAGFNQVVSDAQGPQKNIMVITPSAMPACAELSIGYFSDHVAFTMVAIGEPLSCVTNDPPSNPNLHLKPEATQGS